MECTEEGTEEMEESVGEEMKDYIPESPSKQLPMNFQSFYSGCTKILAN